MIEIIVCILLSAVPGLYVAAHKNFIVIPEHDSFLLRAAFSVPALSAGSIGTAFVIIIFYQLLRSLYGLGSDWSFNAALLSFILSVPAVILIFRCILIPRSVPHRFQNNSPDHELYAYLPKPDYKLNLLYNPPMPRRSDLREKYLRDAAVPKAELKILDHLNMTAVLTCYGEYIINEYGLSQLEAAHLSGFAAKELYDSHPHPYQAKNRYFLLEISSVMMPLSPETKTTKGSYFAVLKDEFIYDPSVKTSASDFNLSFESFNYYDHFNYHTPQKIMIVSKKAAEFMISKFGSLPQDFVPVKYSDNPDSTKA